MSQTSIESYFQTRKRPANDEARGKNKVLILEQNQTRTAVPKLYPAVNQDSPATLSALPEDKVAKFEQNVIVSHAPKLHSVVRNIQFDSPKSQGKSPKSRKPRTRRISVEEGQADIRETFQKKAGTEEAKLVPFEKKGPLTPKKSNRNAESRTPQKTAKVEENVEVNINPTTPKKASTMSMRVQKDMSLEQVKGKLMKSKRLDELRARINKISQLDTKLSKIGKKEENSDASKVPEIKKFDSIELEIPMSPQKTCRSLMMSPTKTIQNPSFGSPNRLMTPKKSEPSPAKVTPTKEPAYKRFADLVSKEEFSLPEHYRLLGEIFRCIDTVTAMLHNRNETVTFSKLKPSIQEMLRRNLTLDHLAQIKFLYPEAFEFKQQKYQQFAQTNKQAKYELVLSPIIQQKSGNDEKTSSTQFSMGPDVLLERRRKMFSLLLEKVMDEHDVFLKSVGLDIDRKELTRWHPAFDVNSCKPIEKAELPTPPNTNETQRSASEVLMTAKKMFNCNTRMEKALQLLSEAEMTSKSSQTNVASDSAVPNTSAVDTPPSTPKVQNKLTNSLLKGIPSSLLEKVRARQAAKALEEMTRPSHVDKEIAMYAQLPPMAHLLRNIFVSEKKNVLTLEFVLEKLDNSYRMKMTTAELEKHVRLMSSLIPTWIMIMVVRKVNYVKLLKNIEISTIVKRFELFAKEKVESFQTKRG